MNGCICVDAPPTAGWLPRPSKSRTQMEGIVQEYSEKVGPKSLTERAEALIGGPTTRVCAGQKWAEGQLYARVFNRSAAAFRCE